jgi:hypothetical protein
VCDLGANVVVAYGVDATTGRTERRGLCRLHLGAGPRHSVLLPPSANTGAARTLLVVNELDSTIVAIALRRVRESGAPAIEMTLCGAPLSTLPADFDASAAPPFPFYTAPSHACAIVADESRSPTQIYVTNRGDDSVATFAVHSAAGSATGVPRVELQKKTNTGDSRGKKQRIPRVELRAHAPCSPGRLPWDLALSSCGAFAVVSTQFGAALDVGGGGIALFARSDGRGGGERPGALSALGGAAACRRAVPNVLLVRFVRQIK